MSTRKSRPRRTGTRSKRCSRCERSTSSVSTRVAPATRLGRFTPRGPAWLVTGDGKRTRLTRAMRARLALLHPHLIDLLGGA